MVKKTKTQIENDSHRKIYERIALQSRREFCLNSRLKKASEDKGLSVNAYIIMHLENALLRDGYSRPETEAMTED